MLIKKAKIRVVRTQNRMKGGFHWKCSNLPNLEWLRYGSVTGNAEINLPPVYHELHITVDYNNNAYFFNIIRHDLTDIYKTWYSGYYFSTSGYGRCLLQVSLSKVKIANMIMDTVDRTSVSITTVYYR